MNIKETHLPGVMLIEPMVFSDQRGWFMESYNQKVLEQVGIDVHFVQDNRSYSKMKGTLRGLHYQLEPKAQAKLVTCLKGAIFDVAVDIRKNSPTYAKWVGVTLSSENKRQLFIPKGFAHGFLTLTDDVEVQYKVDEFYAPAYDRSIRWNDETIGIKWPLPMTPILSKKDECAPLLSTAEINFFYGE
ncbi:dTDP-4-dehydrorhamnose 3,5-epimerase [Bacillus sp. X1(2014)]|nr:dTDP-4-dehydrorhamnose 3,5-epimerase [Bacillus sp. X1(2014)]